MKAVLKIHHHRVFVEGDIDAIQTIANKCVINRFHGNGAGRKVIERINLWDSFTKSFHSGLLPLILKFLSNQIQFEQQDYRSYKRNTITILPRKREYAERELAKKVRLEIEKYHVGYLSSMTGTGKSEFIYDIIELKSVKTLISVPTKGLRDQIAEKLKKLYPSAKVSTDLESDNLLTLKQKKNSDKASKKKFGRKIDVNTGEEIVDNNYEHQALTDKGYILLNGNYVKVRNGIGEKEKKIRHPDILVICNASIPSLPMDYIQSVECYVVDEGHRGKCETIRNFLFEALNCMYRYSVSATPWSDTPEDMKLLIAAFGIQMIYEELPKESIEKGYVKKVNYEQRQARPPKNFIKPSANIQAARDIGVLGNGEYNRQVIEDAIELVESGRTVLLAVTETVHCELLRKHFEDKGVSAHVYHGKIPSSEKAEIIKKAKQQKKKNIFICTIAMGEGVDTTGVNCVMLIDIAKNSNRLIQFGGRGTRLEEGVDELLIIDYNHYYHPKLWEWSKIRSETAQNYYQGDEYMSDKKMKKTGLKFQRNY